ncbi:MAG: tetratricopeptide repeat protein [bacterium]|nr:tetratricopeptide repeat protein [bacterium]
MEKILIDKIGTKFREGNFTDCLKLSEALLKTNKDEFDALCYKGTCLSKLGRHKEAINIITECISIRDNLFFLWSARGDSYYELGEYEDAADDYKKSLELEENGSVMDTCARALFRIGEVDEALILIKKAIDIGKSSEPVIVMITMLNKIGLTGEAFKVGTLGAGAFPEDKRFDNYRN